jgi:N-acetyltransferase
MNLQPTLEDDWLLLRPLQEADFELLFDAAKDPLIWAQHPSQRYLPDVFDRFFQDSLAAQAALVAINKEDRSIIGSSRYKLYPGTPRAVEIGGHS